MREKEGLAKFLLIMGVIWLSAHMHCNNSVEAFPGSTTICPFKDNKKAGVTFVIDDGYFDVINLKYSFFFRKTGLKGTAAIITSDIGEAASTATWSLYYPLLSTWPTWLDWIGIVSQGAIDIANHSFTHPELTLVSPYRLEYEVNGSKTIIDANLPNYQTICYIYPYDVHDQTVRAKVAERHFAARGGQPGYNKLPIADDQFYQLLQKDVLKDTTAALMNSWVETAIQQKAWVIQMWHDCDSMSGWWPAGSPPCQVIEDHVSYVATRLQEVWNGTFQELTKYIRESQSAVVSTEIMEEKRVLVNLNHNLNPLIFNYPLTLKTELSPAFLTGAEVLVTQQFNTRKLWPVFEDDQYFVYYDALPNEGVIEILASDYQWRTFLPLIFEE